MSEVVREWVKENLLEQMEETRGTIANEKMWLLGSDTEEAIAGHAENIKLLCEYMDYLSTQLRDIMTA